MSRRRTPPVPQHPQQISFVPPDGAVLLHLVRENLRLVAQLVTHYEVPGLLPPQSEANALVMRSPADIAGYLGPELAADRAAVRLLGAPPGARAHDLAVCPGGAGSSRLR